MQKLTKLFTLIPIILFLSAGSLSARESLLAVAGVKTIYYMDANRPIIADVYYPVDSDQKGELASGVMVQVKQARNALIKNPKDSGYPLIILSHGYGGSRQHMSWLAESLSTKGYVVAAIEHFGNTSSFDTPKIALQRWLRPLDATEFLNQFLQDSNWNRVVDPNKIGFAGFSLGGLTGVWLVGGIADKFEKPVVGKSSIYELAMGATQADVDGIDYTQAKKSYKDARIKSAFLIAPAHGFSFSPNGLKDITAPVFIIVGEKDAVAPQLENSGHYAKNIKGSELQILKGKVSHLAFRNRIHYDKLNCVNAFEFETNPEVDIQAVHRQTAELAITFFDKTLRHPLTK